MSRVSVQGWPQRLASAATAPLRAGFRRGRPQSPPIGPHEVEARTRAWLLDEVCAPHPQLGRDGPVCPFTQPAMDRELLSVHVSSAASRADIMAEVLAHADELAAEPRRPLRCRVLVFPEVRGRTTLKRCVDAVRQAVIAHDLVAGLFTPASTGRPLTGGVAHNPDYIPRSPHSCVVLRYLSLHDIDQVKDDPDRLARYRARFDDHFAAGRVRDQRILDAYRSACQDTAG